MTVNATSGGYKISYYYDNRRENYNGVTGNQTVTLTFDFQRPTHCIETTTCAPEDKLIDVGPEIDKQVRLQLSTHRLVFVAQDRFMCSQISPRPKLSAAINHI